MPQQELLRRVVRVFEANGIEYMVTGSWASSLQGEPRATHDIGLVVELRPEQVDALVDAFPQPEFHVTKSSALEAIRRRRMFNLLQVPTGDKVDFWILSDEAFDRSRFARRQKEPAFGFDLFVSSPEDTILMKLVWAKKSGGSEKQFGDALRVYEVQQRALDRAYLDEWAERLSVSSFWQRLRNEATSV